MHTCHGLGKRPLEIEMRDITRSSSPLAHRFSKTAQSTKTPWQPLAPLLSLPPLRSLSAKSAAYRRPISARSPPDLRPISARSPPDLRPMAARWPPDLRPISARSPPIAAHRHLFSASSALWDRPPPKPWSLGFRCAPKQSMMQVWKRPLLRNLPWALKGRSQSLSVFD
jgi:hypothetical protein